MNIKNEKISVLSEQDEDLVVWGDKYATGIEMIDLQHKELVRLTNHLYKACLHGGATAGEVFIESMHGMVNYVRFHFSAELVMLERIGFPGYHEHKKEHEGLVRQILVAEKEFEGGKKTVPHNFVRTLKDWVFGHIAITDKIYSTFVIEQKKKGLLSDALIKGPA